MLAISSITAISFQMLFASISIQSYICQPPEVPVITNPSNGATITGDTLVSVEGSATADTSVMLTDNSQAYATVTADQNNKFRLQTTFTSGDHTLGIRTTNPCGVNSGASIDITVLEPPKTPTPPQSSGQPDDTTDQAKPRVDSPLTNKVIQDDGLTRPSKMPADKKLETKNDVYIYNVYPKDGTNTSDVSVYLTGQINVPATVEVSIKGKVVASTEKNQASFGISIPLELGRNDVSIIAKTLDKQAAKTLTIFRNENRKNETANTVWYQTTPGKIIIATSIAAVILVIILLVLL